MARLSKQELAWLEKLQEVLSQCPSKRLGFYANGDEDVAVYNKDRQSEVDSVYDDLRNSAEYGHCVNVANACFEDGPWLLWFPSAVHSVAG